MTLKEYAEAVSAQQQCSQQTDQQNENYVAPYLPYPKSVCPCCGRCPHCGRGGYDYWGNYLS